MHLYIRIKVIYRWPLVASLSNPEFWYIHLSLMMAQQAETRLAIDANFRYWYIFGYWSNAWLYVYTSDFYLSLSVTLKLIFTPVIWYEDLVMWVSWTRSNITYLYLEKSRYSLQTWLSLLNSIPDVYAYCFVSIMHLYIRIKVIYRWPLVASLSNPEFWYIHLSLMMAQQAETRLAIDANFR